MVLTVWTSHLNSVVVVSGKERQIDIGSQGEQSCSKLLKAAEIYGQISFGSGPYLSTWSITCLASHGVGGVRSLNPSGLRITPSEHVDVSEYLNHGS